MSKGFIARKTITIHAPLAAVWKGLTDPEEVKKYFFGTQQHTTWQPGTPIRFTGEWEGKPYEDKGTVLKFEPLKMLRYDYWSNWSGDADVKENYQVITYRIAPKGNSTLLTIQQSNIPTLDKKIHSAQTWGVLMKSLKELLEG
ncbi:MAG: SRPBCC domain-containing protein [Bacteroidetes bacterium]|nr:SRPBCC domain-containing protein [Bacteroidota bacterium]